MADRTTYESTVIFADVAGSSRLYQEVGDQEANRCISQFLQRMAEIIQQHEGTVIKTIGDEIMAHIPNPSLACDAAVIMQQVSQQTLPVKIGMAWGEVIEMDADLYGQTVNDAAAVARIARGGQVITTGAFKAQLKDGGAAKLSLFDRVRLKGGESQTEIFRLEWKPKDATLSTDHTMMAESTALEQEILELTYNSADEYGRKLIILSEDTPFSIGRSGGNGRLTVAASFVSREHCEICYEHNKFILRDHSSNGTHITTGFGQSIFIRRGEFPLVGSGSIALGRKPGGNNLHVIRYNG